MRGEPEGVESLPTVNMYFGLLDDTAGFVSSALGGSTLKVEHILTRDYSYDAAVLLDKKSRGAF